MTYVLGIDGGTESLRVRVFDLEGRSPGAASAPYETSFLPGARAEQNPDDWWAALGVAVKAALAASRVDPAGIKAMALATTCCTVAALDRDGRPVRPALLWMDVRAAQEADDVLATGDPALRVNGAGQGPVSAEWMIPKALWLARHEPEHFGRATTICEYQDVLNLRLTGRRVASLSNAAARWHYAVERGWPVGLLRALGLEALEAKWPAEVLRPGDIVGPLTSASAEHLGLRPSTLVVQGGPDALIGTIGLGVTRPGQLALITGSSHLQFGVTAHDVSVPGLWGAYRDVVTPGRAVLEGGQTSTGSIIAWLRRLAGGTLDLDLLNREAARLEPGCDGLLVLDHFQGNRTPYTDPLSRGAVTGLTLAHGLPHIFRGILEGICFGTRAIVDRMGQAGFAGQEIVVGGGATASRLWLEIHADTAGLPVSVPETSEAPALGAAILAAVGLGHYPTIDAGVAAMVRPGFRIEPDPVRARTYDALYRRYQALYPTLRTLP